MSADYPENIDDVLEKIQRMVDHYADCMNAPAVRGWLMAKAVIIKARRFPSAAEREMMETPATDAALEKRQQ